MTKQITDAEIVNAALKYAEAYYGFCDDKDESEMQQARKVLVTLILQAYRERNP